MIDRKSGITGMESCDFLMIQLSQLLLYITHMFQSGKEINILSIIMNFHTRPCLCCFLIHVNYRMISL